MSDAKRLTVVIDPDSDECLYVNGVAWKHTGETTVFASDLAEAAGGKPVILEHVEAPFRLDGWPTDLSSALDPPEEIRVP